MIYYAVFSMYDAVKAMFGYQKSGASMSMVPHTVIMSSPESMARPLSSSATQVQRSQDALPIEWRSVSSEAVTPPSASHHGAIGKLGEATLKGSPKALGWSIDEAEEDHAWVLLMHDAIQGSVYDVKGDEEDTISLPTAPSEQEITHFFASKEQTGVGHVWRIIPSLSGAHQWVLHREAESMTAQEVISEPEVIRVEMQVDTNDLIDQSHQEATVQTVVKVYADACVQAEEPEPAVPAGALAPLPESTDLVDILPADLRPVTPGETELTAEPTLIDSRSGTPNSLGRIPRLISRRGSLASFKSGTSNRSASPVPAGGSPIPTPATHKLVNKATDSFRSMALRRASSKASMGPLPPTPEAKDVEVIQSDKKKAGGRLFDAVKRISRADSTVKGWKP